VIVVRRFVLSVLLVLSSAVAGVGLAPNAQAATVGLSDPQTGRIANEDPANFTPHILNGTVYSIVQVGDLVVVGGTFTQVRTAASPTVITRNRVFAFNATTGAISNFNPAPNGTVYKVQQAADGHSIYVGGAFTSAAGKSMSGRLFKWDLTAGADGSGGALVTAFTGAPVTGNIRDLEVIGNHLFVAGKFTHINGVLSRGLGTENATTGVRDPYFTNALAGLHRPEVSGSVTDVLQISSNPQNTELVAVGNFTTVNDQPRSQIAKFDLGTTNATLSPWSTNQFTAGCSTKFDTYMTDVEYSPDGSYFIVSTTGAYGGGTGSNNGTVGCDGVFRFEAGSSTPATANTWSAYTGGDTTWNIEVTDNVIYAGGHQRWQNNPNAGDSAGAGAVSREGIAALNPVNGMPYSWNPTRTRGVGIQDMLATPAGLWVGSDTDRFGQAYEYHGKIAFVPLAGGKTLPAENNMTLPGDVYNVTSTGSTLNRRSFDGTTPGAVSTPGTTGTAPTWNTTTGAFMVNGVLYTTATNGTFSKRTFNGSAYGAATALTVSDAIVQQAEWHTNDVPNLTSLFYYNGRMYFTKSGQSTLYRRGFEVEDDVVGQQRFTSSNVTGINYSTMRGAFVANNLFYFADTSGRLWRAQWAGTAPVAGTAVQISGPGKDAQTWSSRSMFVFQGSGQQIDQPPVPVADVHCTDMSCTYDASDSTDPDGTIASVLWQFGDGATSTDAVTNHTYLTAGPVTVTLTVTDNDGTASSTTVSVNPQPPAGNQPPTAVIGSVTCTLLACDFTSTGSGDSDGNVAGYLWDFGDGTSTDANPHHDFTTPGAKHVTLTVTDNENATGTTSKDFSVSDTASPVSFIGVNETNANRTNHDVTVPAGTQPGDVMLLFFSANSTNPTFSSPAGWTAVASPLNGTLIVGRAYTKVATASDTPGTVVRITSSAIAKSDMTLASYRGATGVAASAGNLETVSRAAHTSPTVNAPAGSKWLVTYWADKTSATTAWAPPAGQTFRSNKFGSPSGAMSGLLVDSNADVSGSTGGLTATANSSTNRALSFSIVLQ
jgi:PKD repeat protein